MAAAETFFFYGTLLDEGQLASVLGGASTWRFIGNGTIGGLLYDVGPYPALQLGDDADRVHGAVFEFADGAAALARLDDYEEAVAARLYLRRRVCVRLDDDPEIDAWVYEYARSVAGLRRIASGYWFRRT